MPADILHRAPQDATAHAERADETTASNYNFDDDVSIDEPPPGVDAILSIALMRRPPECGCAAA